MQLPVSNRNKPNVKVKKATRLVKRNENKKHNLNLNKDGTHSDIALKELLHVHVQQRLHVAQGDNKMPTLLMDVAHYHFTPLTRFISFFSPTFRMTVERLIRIQRNN